MSCFCCFFFFWKPKEKNYKAKNNAKWQLRGERLKPQHSEESLWPSVVDGSDCNHPHVDFQMLKGTGIHPVCQSSPQIFLLQAGDVQ